MRNNVHLCLCAKQNLIHDFTVNTSGKQINRTNKHAWLWRIENIVDKTLQKVERTMYRTLL